jgi:hypothetical protein
MANKCRDPLACKVRPPQDDRAEEVDGIYPNGNRFRRGSEYRAYSGQLHRSFASLRMTSAF